MQTQPKTRQSRTHSRPIEAFAQVAAGSVTVNAAPARSIRGLDRPSKAFDDGVTDGEPEPGTLPGGFSGDERVKHLVQDRRVDTGPIVFNHEMHDAGAVGGTYFDRTLAAERVCGVEQQVQE